MKQKNIAIVGFSDSSRRLAPYDDPDWEIWGCNHVHAQPGVKRVDVAFEIHDLEELAIKYGAIPEVGWPGYLEQLAALPRVFMKETIAEVPKSERFPIDQIEREFSWVEEVAGHEKPIPRERKMRTVFKSTLSYMLGLAILKRPKYVGIWGADMVVDFEWGFQRHNMHFFMGWAKGAGIELVIPAECALMKEEDGIELYAYEHNIAPYGKVIDALKKSINEIEKQWVDAHNDNEATATRIDEVQGTIAELERLVEFKSLDHELLSERIIALKDERAKLLNHNKHVMMLLQKLDGGKEREMHWLEKLGFNSRGEQLL